MALVILLLFIALSTALIVAVFTMVHTERQSVSSFTEGARARLLADMAPEIIIGQLTQATQPGQDQGWLSFPGGVIKFGAALDTGTLFKLYSSKQMVAGMAGLGSGFFASCEDIPAGWDSQKDRFVDLNAPIVDASTNQKIFPILDPRTLINDPGNFDDVAADGIRFVDTRAGGKVIWSANATDASLPMPVQWLYVLEDGTVEALNEVGQVPSATEDNRIVGRIAFWADDETCKVNINTAGGASHPDDKAIETTNNLRGGGSLPGLAQFDYGSEYWALPVGFGIEEQMFANRSPVKNEFTRYPGHPAGTRLDIAFPTLTSHQAAFITPRILDNRLGSDNGKRYAGQGHQIGKLDPNKPHRRALYASLDELAFFEKVPPADPIPAQNSPRLRQPGIFSPTEIDRLRFLLTTHSRAPDLTSSGFPRVSMWPIDVQPGRRTELDKWMAQVSTVGGQLFSFVRDRPNNPTHDLNLAGSSGGVSYSNPNLLNYLLARTDSRIPGFGNSKFMDKYGASGTEQILLNIFDYIRMTNAVDSSNGAHPYTLHKTLLDAHFTQKGVPIENPVHLPTIGEIVLNYEFPGVGQVVPSTWVGPRSGETHKGIGRFYLISEFLLHFYTVGVGTQNATHKIQNVGGVDYYAYRINLYPDFVNPAPGYSALHPNLEVHVLGLQNWTLEVPGQGTVPITFPVDASGRIVQHVFGKGMHQRGNPAAAFPHMNALIHLGQYSPRTAWFNPAAVQIGARPQVGFPSSPQSYYYNLMSQEILIRKDLVDSPTPLQVRLNPQPLTVELQAIDTSRSGSVHSWSENGARHLIQTYAFHFPPVDLPLPKFPAHINPELGNWQGGHSDRIRWRNRTNGAGWFAEPQGNNRFDIMLSLEPTMEFNDYRYLAMHRNVPASAFVPHSKYFTDPFIAHNHAFNNSAFASDVSSRGNLLPGFADLNAKISSFLNGVSMAGGILPDYERAYGSHRAGPWINKPDEGNPNISSQTPYFDNFQQSAALPYEAYHSPNRMIASPVMLGSLPAGKNYWRTLLFNPRPLAGAAHPGHASPPDYVLLDLFTMPVVEPWAISEPFSTSGKINMNYRIIPFTYLQRDVGMRSVLRSTRVPMPNPTNQTNFRTRRHVIADETLKEFERRFDEGRFFRMAPEICAVDLYFSQRNRPFVAEVSYNPGGSNMSSFHAANANDMRHLGDNVRERPYADLLSRLTTQSNTYTVHVRAEAIRKARGTDPKLITPKDTVTGEYRGSFLIERYLDPNLKTYDNSRPLSDFKFRTVQVRRFAP